MKPWLKWAMVSVCMVAILMPAGCGTPAATEVPTAPAEATAPPEATAPAEATAAPQPTPEQEIPHGGSLIFCMWEDPGVDLNPFKTTLHYWMAGAMQGLITWDPDGNPQPMLAAEVPTLENGGVSEDAKTITYKLQEGIKWADGEPFTCEDVKFTIEGVANPENTVASRAGYEDVESVECPDELTAVVKYSEYYAPWITIPRFVVPKHLLEDYPNWDDSPWVQNLLGTGPFYVTENVQGDHVTFEANPYYREEGKPYLDQFIIKYVGSREVGIAQFKSGDCDIYWDISQAEIAEFLDDPNVQIFEQPLNLVETLWLNLSPSSGPDTGNPDVPHPILGDVRVRQAIEFALDRQTAVDEIMNGLSRVGTTIYPNGYFADPNFETRPYDPEQAKALLEEAGWIDQDGDGIRECHGCLYANEGDKAQITLTTLPGQKLKEMEGTLYIDNLKQVGIEMTFNTVDMTEFYGFWADDGIQALGKHDIALWADTSGMDPQEMMHMKFHSSQIPLSATQCGDCWNWTRFKNAEFDQLIDEAAQEKDPEARKEMFFEMYRILQEQVPAIWLFDRPFLALVQPYVKGFLGPYGSENANEYITTYLADFYMEE